MTLDGASASFLDSTVTLSGGGRTVTVTVGAVCTGTGCTALGTVTATPNLSFIAATTITDIFGNIAGGTKTQAIRLF